MEEDRIVNYIIKLDIHSDQSSQMTVGSQATIETLENGKQRDKTVINIGDIPIHKETVISRMADENGVIILNETTLKDHTGAIIREGHIVSVSSTPRTVNRCYIIDNDPRLASKTIKVIEKRLEQNKNERLYIVGDFLLSPFYNLKSSRDGGLRVSGGYFLPNSTLIMASKAEPYERDRLRYLYATNVSGMDSELNNYELSADEWKASVKRKFTQVYSGGYGQVFVLGRKRNDDELISIYKSGYLKRIY